MDSPGYIVLSRLVAQSRSVAVTANNIANADTPGYRAVRPLFGSLLARQQAADTPPGGSNLAFTLDRATWRDATPGALSQTSNPLDIAIGATEGFFAVQTPRGERYTRAGRFMLDAEGRVVDAEGNALLGNDGEPLQILPNETQIEVLGDGTLRTENGPVAQIRVVSFPNPQLLTAEGDRLLVAPPDMPPQAVAQPRLIQGAVESSNVRPILELTRMTEELRQFQFAAQMVEREGDRLGSAVERILRRR